VSHIEYDNNNKSSKVTEALENSEEIQELEPHKEYSNGLEYSLRVFTNGYVKSINCK